MHDGKPAEEAKWTQTVVYDEVSCVMDELKLFQKCESCNVEAASGDVAGNRKSFIGGL